MNLPLLRIRPKAGFWAGAAIAVFGFVIAVQYLAAFRSTGQVNDFAQVYFSAAVARACGHGFSDIDASQSPALAEFLASRRDAITCADLAVVDRFGPPSLTQGLYRYLMETVAAVWRVRGISWSGLWPVFGVAYAASLLAVYGLCRLGMGIAVATSMTLLFGVSAIHLSHVVLLRDYAKAPFILTLMLIVACLARRDAGVRRRLWLSVAFGAVLGVGFGFRNDLLVMLPAFGAIVVARFGGFRRTEVAIRLVCAAAAAAAFAIAAWPLLVAYSRGSNTAHVILLGFMSPFDGPLGVRPAIYDWGHAYSDSLVATMADSYSVRIDRQSVQLYSAAYDRALMDYVRIIAANFPADMVTRAYGSVSKIFELPFAVGAYTNSVPYAVEQGAIVRFYGLENALLQRMQGTGIYLAIGALAAIAALDFRGALLLTAVTLYFAGYPALQFHVRHFFYLEFITWWALGFLIQAFVVGPRRVLPPRAWLDSAKFVVVSAAVLCGSLVALRIYQDQNVATLLARYHDAPRGPVETTPQMTADGHVLFAAQSLWGRYESDPQLASAVETEYLTATFLPGSCATAEPRVRISYLPADNAMGSELSRAIVVPMSATDAPTSVAFPAFSKRGAAHFAGIELLATDARCFKGLERTLNLAGLDLALNIMFLPDWRSHGLHQTLVNWESDPAQR